MASKFLFRLAFIVELLFIVNVASHNYLVWPVSRANQRQTQTGCRLGGEGNPTCAGPCDRTAAQANIAPITVQRGQTLQINWSRHTHPGGFIRFAWSPTSQSDSHSSFDSHVDRIVCKEIGGCGPSDPSNPSGGTNGVDCGTTITVPTYLTDGTWTLQWAYFGGWYNAGDYYACVDYVISGGPTGTQQPAFYRGGDYTYPNDNVCLFYSTNALHVCPVEPCTTGNFAPGNQRGPAAGFSSSPTPTPTPTPSTPLTTSVRRTVTTKSLTTKALTTKALTSSPLTTKSLTTRARTLTTSAERSLTTHSQPVNVPITSGKLTTGRQHSSTTSTPPRPLTTGYQQEEEDPDDGDNTVTNCASATVLSLSQASISSIDSWGSGSSAVFRAVVQIDVQESVLSNWLLEVVFPQNQIQPMLTNAFNSGKIRCQSNQPFFHAMIEPQSWARTATSGTTLTVEIMGNNIANLSPQAIVANTLLKVYVE